MLMVIMFVMVMILLVTLSMLFLILLSNFEMVIISVKIFNVGFFGDLEIMLTVWTLLFLFMVLIISSSVAMFSFSYMSGITVSNFVLLYLSFIFSMVWLIINNSFYWMMLGWDGLGVVSFLLIVFYMNHESINNGLFTLFQNRIGDLFFVLFIVGVMEMSMVGSVIVKYGILFLILGGCVKSAQFPFNSWLLAAMSAPTPISALVHSSTLVVAGVFILLQFSYCLVDMLDVLKYISLLTLLLSTTGLLIELDMKKLIAYSTLSHVSLMMFMLSLKLFKVVYFHLNIHAMFKSTMFMCFGFVMLASFHGQDKRLVSLNNLNPLLKMLYYFSSLCLMGLPFLSGFFSKDFIIEKTMEFNQEFFLVVLLLLFLGVSVYYGLKLLSLVNVFYSYTLVEKSYLGMFGVLCMMAVMVGVINLYLSLMLTLTLEIFSFKMMIYLFVLGFFILSVMSQFTFKFNSYDKIKSFKEVWMIDVYKLDQYVYWSMSLIVGYMSVLSNIKLILLMNWWVLVFLLVLF
uniref:NADH:ubiquinone reductase (H(+)-translocating) n=1 Tax=Rotaria rotatoria TaxID=231624 RepID=D1KRS9_9BILA|nr:NADH dehydrogenase subunit 5 [Rotaria rotatoria]ACT21461.1 NADH dehydrogenase subunit 5 [Rotaria rotatoria]